MPTQFDNIIERRSFDSFKWNLFDADVIPMFVADMDFRSPEPILRALHDRVEHGLFGYHFNSPQVRQTIADRVKTRYNWDIKPEALQFSPNLVSALNFVCRAFAPETNDEVIMLTPAYPPFLGAPGNNGRTAVTADLSIVKTGQIMRYEIDFDAFEALITPNTKVFMLCNPHNPVGRAWSRAELERLAEISLRHNLIVCSDEIHCDLLLEGTQHIPLATISPEIADRTITLMSPSKTFNMPTLGFAQIIATNETIFKQFEKATWGFLPHVGALGFAAAQAAYTECQPWLDELLPYLQSNRDFLVNYVQQHFPSVGITCPEATYLGWMDWRDAGLPDAPAKFFLENARVALGDGAGFGKAGEGFTRLNFGTPRSVLTEALERIRAAAEKI